MNGHAPHASQHGYVPGLPEYFLRDNYGRVAPPGYAFNVQGELVQLPFEPWSGPPQMAWEDPNNPDYLEFAQGRMTIENQPSADPRLPARYGKQDSVGHRAPVTHQDMTIVPQRAYLGTQGDEVSQQDEGTGSVAIFDMPASPARTRYILGREILGVLQVDPPQPGSPLLVVPVGDSLITPPAVAPVPFFGGAVALGVSQFGHLGTSSQLVFDILPGSLVKIPTVDSFMKLTGRMSPRYFASTTVGTLRQYLLFPGGPVLTNDSFSNLPPNIMELQGSGPGTIVAAGAQSNPINYSGWCGKGLSPTPDEATLPVRIFRGSVLSSAVAPAAPTNTSRIPIPFGAIAVAVFGGIYNPTLGVPSVPITWVQNLDVAGATVGPFPSDGESIIPIVPGATSINVFGGNSAAPGDLEIPFFAYYYLNV